MLPSRMCTSPVMSCDTLQALKEVESLRGVVGNYEKDKAALTQSKARLLQSEKHLKHLEWENEVCLAQFSRDSPVPPAAVCPYDYAHYNYLIIIIDVVTILSSK